MRKFYFRFSRNISSGLQSLIYLFSEFNVLEALLYGFQYFPLEYAEDFHVSMKDGLKINIGTNL